MTGLPIDFVSPLPPVRSGIADYSVDLLGELAPRCDVRLVRLPGQDVATEIERSWPLAETTELDAEQRLPFYQFGNNVYHRAILRLARVEPGVATVHDLRLHHLVVESTLAEGDLDSYVATLGREHGWEGAAAALPTRWGAHGRSRLFELPAHGSLLLRQRGLLTHSHWGERFLREELGEVASGRPLPPIRRVPMPMPAPEAPGGDEARAFRRRIGVRPGVFLLGSFGFQTPIKRTDALIRALALPGMERVHALIAGDVSPEFDLTALARDLGVLDRVAITGFLDPPAFRAAIVACDLCLNLRYPSAGETSASLLRLLALGRPVVVSDYAQFAELPGSVVVKAPLEVEPAAEASLLAGLLRELLDAPARLEAMGEAARSFVVREHDPAAAAEAVVDALIAWSRRPPPDAVSSASVLPPEPARPTSLTWGWLPGRIDIEGMDADWAEGERRTLEIVVQNTGFATWLAGRNAEGGVLLEPQLWYRGRDLLACRPWLRLPRDVAPGSVCRIALPLRRPPGPARLRIEPHVSLGSSMTACGASAFDRAL